MAILELTEIPGFSDEPNWISKRLGIDLKEAELAIHALKEKNFISKNESGEWRKNINSSVHQFISSRYAFVRSSQISPPSFFGCHDGD